MLTFWPNIVGYTRVILLLSSFFYLHSNHRRALLLYGVSFFLDVVDGPLARALGQSSRFGALLDMMTDKFSSPSLLNALSTRHPSMAPLLVGCLVLDVASHLMHLQATALAGVRSHKETKPRWTLVRWFYEVKPFFIWCCLGHEIFLVALYWLSFEQQQALDGSRGPVVLPASWWAPVAEAVGALVKSALGESAADLFELVVGAGAAEAAAAGGGGGGPAAFGETAGAAGEEGQGHGQGLRPPIGTMWLLTMWPAVMPTSGNASMQPNYHGGVLTYSFLELSGGAARAFNWWHASVQPAQCLLACRLCSVFVNLPTAHHVCTQAHTGSIH